MKFFFYLLWPVDIASKIGWIGHNSIKAKAVIGDFEVIIYRLVRCAPLHKPIRIALQNSKVGVISLLSGYQSQFRDNLIRVSSLIGFGYKFLQIDSMSTDILPWKIVHRTVTTPFRIFRSSFLQESTPS